jgi:hypothetical protein
MGAEPGENQGNSAANRFACNEITGMTEKQERRVVRRHVLGHMGAVEIDLGDGADVFDEQMRQSAAPRFDAGSVGNQQVSITL